MMASTHGIIGAVTFAGASALFGSPPLLPLTAVTVGAAAVGAWLPDVDTPTSRAGFCVYPFARWMERRFGHRTITHSVLGTLIFACLCAPLLFTRWPMLWPALLIGYFSHLMADAATKSGVPLAWPNRARWVFPGNEKYRVRTGSLDELGVLAIFALLGVLMIPVAQLGPRRLLHLATASLPGAVRDAEDWGDEWQMEIAVEGYDVLNQKMVNASFPVVGRRDDGTIIIERADAYWMLKKAGTEIYRIDPRHTRLHQVAPRTDQTRVVRVANLSLAALHRALTASLPDTSDPRAAHQILLTGTVNCYPLAPGSAPADAPHFGLKTVQFNATRIEFDFAQPRHLAEVKTPVAIHDATLTIRLPRGARLPTLRFPPRRQILLVAQMRRHAALNVTVGQFVRKGTRLQSTFAQTLDPQPTPEETSKVTQSEAARRELQALDTEENALHDTALWPRLRASFSQRRDRLQVLAAWKPPAAAPKSAPAPDLAPFDGVVESIEWEPPTLPTRPGELPEHAARLTLAQVKL